MENPKKIKKMRSFRLTDEAMQKLRERAEKEGRSAENMLEWILTKEIDGTKNEGAMT